MKQGVIYYRNFSSALFVVEMNDDTFTVFESFDINDFSIGDMISGELSKIGSVNVLNATTQKSTTVTVRKVGCTLTLAMNMANLLC